MNKLSIGKSDLQQKRFVILYLMMIKYLVIRSEYV